MFTYSANTSLMQTRESSSLSISPNNQTGLNRTISCSSINSLSAFNDEFTAQCQSNNPENTSIFSRSVYEDQDNKMTDLSSGMEQNLELMEIDEENFL